MGFSHSLVVRLAQFCMTDLILSLYNFPLTVRYVVLDVLGKRRDPRDNTIPQKVRFWF